MKPGSSTNYFIIGNGISKARILGFGESRLRKAVKSIALNSMCEGDV